MGNGIGSTALALAVVVGAGCVGMDDGNDVPGDDPGDTPGDDPGDTPGDDPEEPQGVPVAGSYALETDIDVTIAAILPESIYGYVALLIDLRDAPGETILDLAIGGGAAGALLDALPGSLESRLGGWLDDAIADAEVNGASVPELLDELLAFTDIAVGSFGVDSELTLGEPNTAGETVAAHRVTALRFGPDRDIRIAVPASAEPPLATDTSLDAWVEHDATSTSVVLDSHTFGLAYGTYAYEAVESEIQDRYGTDLRGALGQIIDCPAIAADVADRCVLGLCVGHEAELTEVCEDGLDFLADELRAQVESIDFDALALDAGEAIATETTLDDGLWAARIDLGGGPRDVPATFTGTRSE